MGLAAMVMASGFVLMGWSPSLAVFFLGYMLARGKGYLLGLGTGMAGTLGFALREPR